MNWKENTIQDNYDSVAKFYGIIEEFSPLLHLYATRIRRVIELSIDLDGLKVLSVGCGPAPLATYILEKKGRYYGIDLSPKILHEARRRNGDNILSLAAGNLEKLPFKSDYFDLLLYLGSLEYINDVKVALKELSRVSRTGAIVIISMQNNLNLYRLWDRYVNPGFLFNSIRKIMKKPKVDKPIERLISLKDIGDYLYNQSIILKDTQYYNFNLFLKPLDRLFSKLSVMTSRRLEFLYHSNMGFLAADFIIIAQQEKQPN